MKKLVFYSDQVVGRSDEIDKELLNLLDKKNPKIAYIPSCSDTTRKYYKQKVEYYGRLGITDLFYFDLDKEFDESKIPELLQCDAIHLSGGDTAYFLSNIKKRGFDAIIKAYADNGGMLIGISAGSIIITETIDIIKVGEDYEDDCNLTDMKGLGLVNFEFMPHWDREIFKLEEFQGHTVKSGKTLYICRDEDGIVVRDNNIKFIGNVIKIQNGMVCNV
jgi:dipeptidase E